jgi:hypothetical protein
MEKPQAVEQAVILIWGTLALSAISSLINKWMGHIDAGQFVFSLIVYGIMCVIPYKISRGSNATRYVYLILTAITILFMLGGLGNDMPKLDLVLSIVLTPVELFILYKLFQKESASWFSSNQI